MSGSQKEAVAELLAAKREFDEAQARCAEVINTAREALDPYAKRYIAARGEAARWFDDPGDAKSIPGMGTVRMVSGQKSVKVVDQAAFTAWVKTNRPEEIVESVLPATEKAYLKAGGVTSDGEVIPGLDVVQGDPTIRIELEKAP